MQYITCVEISHNGRKYKSDEVIELEKKEAATLLKINAVCERMVKASDSPSADEENQGKTPPTGDSKASSDSSSSESSQTGEDAPKTNSNPEGDKNKEGKK